MSNKLRILLLLSVSMCLFSCTYYFGPNKWANKFNETAFSLSGQEDLKSMQDANMLPLIQEEVQAYAKGNYIVYSSKFKDTILNTNKLFAKLLLAQDIAQINEDILRYKAWGTTGTSSGVNKKGDYDFSEIVWIHMVWYFDGQPDILYPSTAKYIIDNYVIDNGFKPTLRAPNTLGMLRETENHTLMKEASRYLKNQWLYTQHPTNEAYDNSRNGMEEFLIEHLEEMLQTGFYEFNANPYISYTINALHVLHSHAASAAIKELTKEILDAENLQYALGSYGLNKYSPFRRRLEKAGEQSLNKDRHGLLIRMELAKYHHVGLEEYPLYCCFDRTLIGAFSPYVLPAYMVDILEVKSESYYAKIGHGIKSSPEIYYGNKHYLLSAGGLRFGKRSQIVPRPITLFLDKDKTTLSDCFHIEGAGVLNQWNNTGVYKNLAVANHEVYVPEAYTLFEKIGEWEVYKIEKEVPVYVCVFNAVDLGVLYVSTAANYAQCLAVNTTDSNLDNNFNFLDGSTISYSLNRKKKWVFTAINDQEVLGNFGEWPRFDISYKTAEK